MDAVCMTGAHSPYEPLEVRPLLLPCPGPLVQSQQQLHHDVRQVGLDQTVDPLWVTARETRVRCTALAKTYEVESQTDTLPTDD